MVGELLLIGYAAGTGAILVAGGLYCLVKAVRPYRPTPIHLMDDAELAAFVAALPKDVMREVKRSGRSVVVDHPAGPTRRQRIAWALLGAGLWMVGVVLLCAAFAR